MPESVSCSLIIDRMCNYLWEWFKFVVLSFSPIYDILVTIYKLRINVDALFDGSHSFFRGLIKAISLFNHKYWYCLFSEIVFFIKKHSDQKNATARQSIRSQVFYTEYHSTTYFLPTHQIRTLSWKLSFKNMEEQVLVAPNGWSMSPKSYKKQ